MAKLSDKSAYLLRDIRDKFRVDGNYDADIKLYEDNMNFPYISIRKEGYHGWAKLYFILDRFFVFIFKEELNGKSYWYRVGDNDKGFHLSKDKDYEKVKDILEAYFLDKKQAKTRFLNQLPEYFEKYHFDIHQIIYEFEKNVEFKHDDLNVDGSIYSGFSGENDKYKISAFLTTFGQSEGWNVRMEDKLKDDIHSIHAYKWGFGLYGRNVTDSCEYVINSL